MLSTTQIKFICTVCTHDDHFSTSPDNDETGYNKSPCANWGAEQKHRGKPRKTAVQYRKENNNPGEEGDRE